MAKYFGSPWGQIRGKVNGLVGMCWKGILTTRALIHPTQRGTIPLWRLLKEGLIPPERFSYPQMNLRRLATQILVKIASDNLEGWIHPVWEPLCKSKGLKMAGMNLFVKRNCMNFYASMNRELEYDPITNSPDLKVLKMSEGELEPTTEITKAEYNTATGILAIDWDPTCYGNGDENDLAQVIIAKKPLLDSYIYPGGNWQAALTLYPFITLVMPEPPAVPHLRKDGTWNVELPPGLDAVDLTLYLFFFAVIENKNIWSASLSLQVTTPA